MIEVSNFFRQAGREHVARLQEEDKQFEQQLIEKLKAEDTVFAADFDVEKKKKETQMQIQIHLQNHLKKSLLDSAGTSHEV